MNIVEKRILIDDFLSIYGASSSDSVILPGGLVSARNLATTLTVATHSGCYFSTARYLAILPNYNPPASLEYQLYTLDLAFKTDQTIAG